MPSGVSFASIAAGWSHTCGLSAAGGAYCWGDNSVGQLGDGTTIKRLTPTPAIMAALSLVSLSADGSTNCGPTLTGTAYCWGDNARGQLGDGTTTNQWTPVAVSAPPGVTFASVETGSSHTCGLTATGAAYCWGDNSEGQLGDGTTTSSLTPTAVTMPGGVTFSSLAVSFFHTCGLTAAGAAYCWGYNGAGEIGDGTTTDRWTPTPVTGGVAFSSLTTVYLHICGLTAAGTAYCWGDNRYGQVGDGTTDAGRWTPTAVAPPAGVSFARLVAGSFHTCGITPAGTTYCWGANTYGQIGDGTETDRWSPTAVGQP
jgi:alpha-tubulin suppressor-like RCC1 family protein